MVGIRFGGGRDELLTFMQYLGVITPPYSSSQAVSCWGDLGVSESISLGAVESIILQ